MLGGTAFGGTAFGGTALGGTAGGSTEADCTDEADAGWTDGGAGVVISGVTARDTALTARDTVGESSTAADGAAAGEVGPARSCGMPTPRIGADLRMLARHGDAHAGGDAPSASG